MHVPTEVGGWTIESTLGSGKSASVFRATLGDRVGAFKIFDPYVVEKYGKHAQLARIQRELSLRDLHHPHLVQIIDGGECSTSGLLFVVMELIPSPNLATVLPDVPRDRIWPMIAQIASAARFLEEHQLAHRDIKPDNVAISHDFEHCTLLDLGVVRPVGIAEITDETQRYFIGTLRYSPPELLVREEQDTLEGWRAVTFYQLGAVLHDLIVQKRLFGDITEPYARLVQAVERDVPTISAADVPADLVFLARNCLQKDPRLRLQLVNWNSFDVPAPKVPLVADLKERIRRRRAVNDRQVDDAEEIAKLLRERTAEIQNQLQGIIRRECVSSGLFPPLKIVGSQDEAPESACTAAVFQESNAHNLAVPLRIWVGLRILDAPSSAIELKAWALVGVDGTEKDGPSPSAIRSIFRGVNDEAVVRPVLQQLLYEALDEAQQLAAQPVAEDVRRWLELSTFKRGE